MSALTDISRGARLVVLVGPGGVGKTTLAAALAIDAADSGRRVALVTIDPARRLAGALGLADRGGLQDRHGLEDRRGLGDSLTPVPGVPRLEAAMLDTKASFDALVARLARSESERRRIVENRVYETFSRTLARPHAYVAMERLVSLLEEGTHDLVVLDTPPTRSALDILDAPGRLARFLGGSVAETLVGALGEDRAGARSWLRRRGGAAVSSLLARVLGAELLTDLASFFEVFFHLRHGFAERAARAHELLRDARTAFVLASAPDGAHIADAASLAQGLEERGILLAAVLSNRVYHLGDTGAATDDNPLDLTTKEQEILGRARAYRTWLHREAERRAGVAAAFVAALPGTPRHLAFASLPEPPLDVSAVRALAGSAREFARSPVSL